MTYRCEKCGESAATPFDCCGPVAGPPVPDGVLERTFEHAFREEDAWAAWAAARARAEAAYEAAYGPAVRWPRDPAELPASPPARKEESAEWDALVGAVRGGFADAWTEISATLGAESPAAPRGPAGDCPACGEPVTAPPGLMCGEPHEPHLAGLRADLERARDDLERAVARGRPEPVPPCPRPAPVPPRASAAVCPCCLDGQEGGGECPCRLAPPERRPTGWWCPACGGGTYPCGPAWDELLAQLVAAAEAVTVARAAFAALDVEDDAARARAKTLAQELSREAFARDMLLRALPVEVARRRAAKVARRAP